MAKANKTAEIMRSHKESRVEAILREMDAIKKQVEHLAYKVNWRASKANEQEPLVEQFRKFAAYRNSNFIQAGEALLSHYKPDRDTITVDEYAAFQQLALYYFATNKDIDPTEPGGMSKARLEPLYRHLDRALAIQQAGGMTLEQAVDELIGIPTQRRTKTQSRGITEVYERVVSITDKTLQWALTPYQSINGEPYIAQLGDDILNKLVFNKNGAVSFLDSRASEDEVKKATEARAAKDFDIPLLRQLFTVVYHNAKDYEGSRIRVHLPALCKGMGIDTTKDKPYDIFSKINRFRNLVGFTDKGLYSVLTFSEYEFASNDITLDSPYLHAIFKQLNARPPVKLKSGETYLNPACSFLVHSDIAKERNKAAVEIVHAIIALLHQRGGVSDEQIANNNKAARESKRISRSVRAEKASDTTVTAHKAFAAIIEVIPILKERLKGKTAGADNAQLKRAFSRAYDLLRTKTDAYEYFIGLEVSDIIPTVTTLEQVLTIKHQGINTAYETRM